MRLCRTGIFPLALLVAAAGFYGFTYNRSSYAYILRADEGYSFAVSVRAAEGLVPQKDFSYAYGPFMPYVYAGVFKLAGPSLAALRLTWAVLYIITVLLFYRIGLDIVPAWTALAAALMVIGQAHTPLYSYNHVGFVIVAELLVLCAFQFSGRPSFRYGIYLGALFLIGLLIKFNEAIAVYSAVMAATIFVAGRRRKAETGELSTGLGPHVRNCVIGALSALVIFALITAWLNSGLTRAQFLRNFPILPQYQASVGGYQYVIKMLLLPWKGHWTDPGQWYGLWYENYYFAIIVSLATGAGIALYFAIKVLRDRTLDGDQNIGKAVILLTVAFAIQHEFYLTGNHWSTPMYVGFSLLALSYLLRSFLRWPQLYVGATVALLLVCLASDCVYAIVARQTFSEFSFDSARARIFSSETSDAVVSKQVVDYLAKNTGPSAELAAFPHDAALIHLAGRRNAMRDDDYQWMLFPTPESDHEIVQEIERRKVPSVLVSNFAGVKRGKLVIFGRDYLPETFQYLQDHYHQVVVFQSDHIRYRVGYFERNEDHAEHASKATQNRRM